MPFWLSLFLSGPLCNPKNPKRERASFCESIAPHNPGRNMILERERLNENTNFGLIYRDCEIILITSPIAARLANTHFLFAYFE